MLLENFFVILRSLVTLNPFTTKGPGNCLIHKPLHKMTVKCAFFDPLKNDSGTLINSLYCLLQENNPHYTKPPVSLNPTQRCWVSCLFF